MNEYTKGLCTQYSVDVKSNGIAYFTIIDGDHAQEFDINLKDNDLFEGDKGYSPPHPERHLICHEDGEIIATPFNYTRLVFIDWTGGVPKTFFRARQWEFDWWMSEKFPESANAQVYRMVEQFAKFEM